MYWGSHISGISAVVPGTLTKMQNISSPILELETPLFKLSLSQIILSSPGATEPKQHGAGALSHIRGTDPAEMSEQSLVHTQAQATHFNWL